MGKIFSKEIRKQDNEQLEKRREKIHFRGEA